MKPEMEKPLRLFDEAQNSPEHEKLFEAELKNLNAQYPGLSRGQLRRIVRTAYLRWLRAHRKPPTIPQPLDLNNLKNTCCAFADLL